MTLTEKQIIHILDNNLIDTCNEKEKKQVFNFAFGEEFIKSKDKGTLKEYHDCWDYPMYYEFFVEGDTHRYHGYECEICGKLLQTG